MTIHQKSESCSCGKHLNAEGDEDSVLAACEDFRFRHQATCHNTNRVLVAALDTGDSSLNAIALCIVALNNIEGRERNAAVRYLIGRYL